MTWEERSRQSIDQILDDCDRCSEPETRRKIKNACPYAPGTLHREAWLRLVATMRRERRTRARPTARV